MTIENLIETIQQIFPKIGETQILKEIDNVQKYLTAETKSLIDYAMLSNLSSALAWRIPSLVVEVKDVKMFDSEGKKLLFNQYNMAYKIKGDIIYVYSTITTPLETISSDISTIDVSYYRTSNTITSIEDKLEIDEQYHDALEAKLFERMYSRFPTVNDNGILRIDYGLVRYWSSVYKDIRKRLLARSTKGKDGRMPNIISYPYAGKFTQKDSDRLFIPKNVWEAIPYDPNIGWDELGIYWENL